jgi:hypothetical protein
MEQKEKTIKKIRLRKIKKTDYQQIVDLQLKFFP